MSRPVLTRIPWKCSVSRRRNHVQLMSLQAMPSPLGLPVFGTMPAVLFAALTCRIHKYVDERHKELGRLFRDRLGTVDTVVTSDPDIMRTIFTSQEGKYPSHLVPDTWTLYNDKLNVKRGLFFMEGDEWLQTRRVMNRLLLKPSSDGWIRGPVSTVTDNFIASWAEKCSAADYEPHLDEELYKLSLDVALAVMLGSAYSSHCQRFQDLMGRFSKSIHDIFVYSSRMYMLPGKLYERFKFPSWKGFERSVTESLSHGEQLISQVYKLEDKGDGLLAKMTEEGLSQTLATRVLVDMILAAGDTTAFTTQWILYLLSKNPNVIDEFISCEPNSDAESTFAKGIIKEAMRLYPVAAFITRILPAATDVGGYIVPAGTVVVMSLYTSGRDECLFPNPLTFHPTRWIKTADNKREWVTPHGSLPFAMGARSCIGRKIAVSQMSQFIIKVLRKFNLKSLNRGEVEDIMQLVVRPKQKIRILLQMRV